MKKNLITKIVATVAAVAMAISPVDSFAATKRVITRAEFEGYYEDAIESAGLTDDDLINKTAKDTYMKLVAGMKGAYQKNGLKIYPVLNGKVMTIKKTGSYSIVVGGSTAKKDEGTVKFVAPKTGTYKLTFDTRKNVAGGSLYIDQLGVYVKQDKHQQIALFSAKFKNGKHYTTKDGKKSADILISDNGCAWIPKTGSLADYALTQVSSEMTHTSGTVKLKKGQTLYFTARASDADMKDLGSWAYHFVGYDLKIEKVK